jgi:hypothetical protein
VNLAPRGEICTRGGIFTPSFTPGPRGEHSLLFRRWRVEKRISPPGDNFTPGDEIHPWGTNSPLR